MRWSTRSHLHLDRTASAWCIAGFIDPAAEFCFLGWDTPVDTSDPHCFGMPGVVLSGHDEAGTCLAKILREYSLTEDPALLRVERAVAAGVRHALDLPLPPGQTRRETEIGNTLDGLGLALSLRHDDAHHLRVAGPLYDALYTYLQLDDLGEITLPETQPARVAALRAHLGITASPPASCPSLD
jgi:hypothetical protein